MLLFRRIHFVLFSVAFIPLIALFVFLYPKLKLGAGFEPFLIATLPGLLPGAIAGIVGSLAIIYWKDLHGLSSLARLKYVIYWLVTGSLLGGATAIIGWGISLLLYRQLPWQIELLTIFFAPVGYCVVLPLLCLTGVFGLISWMDR